MPSYQFVSGGQDGQDIYGVDGATGMRRKIGRNRGIASMMSVIGLMATASAVSAQGPTLKGPFDIQQKAIGNFNDPSNKRFNGLQALTTGSGTVADISVSIDPTSLATLANSVKEILGNLGKALDGWFDVTQTYLLGTALFVEMLGKRELWAMLLEDLDDQAAVMFGIMPGSPMAQAALPSLQGQGN